MPVGALLWPMWRVSSLLMGADGATVNSVAHLRGANPSLLAAIHQAYLAEVCAGLGVEPELFDLWRRVHAAARLDEVQPGTELLAVWSQGSVSERSGAG